VAPRAPGRREAVYLWEHLAHAERNRAEFLPTGIIHTCRAEGEAFRGEMELVTPGINWTEPIEPQLAALREGARKYWRASRAGSPDRGRCRAR
jgi:hypothetical protein